MSLCSNARKSRKGNYNPNRSHVTDAKSKTYPYRLKIDKRIYTRNAKYSQASQVKKYAKFRHTPDTMPRVYAYLSLVSFPPIKIAQIVRVFSSTQASWESARRPSCCAILYPSALALSQALTSKLSARKRVRTVSPLFTALVAQQSGLLSSTDAMALRCHLALDAIRRGAGSNALFSLLGRHLVVATNLGSLGYRPEGLETLRVAQQALLRMRRDVDTSGAWNLDTEAYSALCSALAHFDAQLAIAPVDQVARAQRKMLALLSSIKKAA